MAQQFLIQGGFIANGDSKITGNLDVSGNLLNLSSASNIADKAYVDSTITAAVAGLTTGTGDIIAVSGQANGDWGTTEEYSIKNIYTRTQKQVLPESAAPNSSFGFCSALSGDGTWMVVGMPNFDTPSTNFGQIVIYKWNPVTDTWDVNQTIQSPYTSGSSPQFGYSVDINETGEYIIVGAPNMDQGSTDYGYAYIFKRNTADDTWSVVKQGYSSYQNATYNYFGWCVRISDDGLAVAIGCPGSDAATTDAGHIEFWESSNGGVSYDARNYLHRTHWSTSSSPQSDFLGRQFDMSGDGLTVVIGVPESHRYNLLGSLFDNAGHVLIARRTARTATWGAVSSKIIVEPEDWDNNFSNHFFGRSIGISANGDHIVVGCEQCNYVQGGVTYTTAGAFYYFKRNAIDPETWNFVQRFNIYDLVNGDKIPMSLSMSKDGKSMVVGSEFKTTTSFDELGRGKTGAAYLFTRQGDVWSQRAKILQHSDYAVDTFGGAVSISHDGTTVCIGAEGDDTQATNNGCVYTLRKAQAMSVTYTQAGRVYQIVTAGDSDFTTIGAADNLVGTIFTATGNGTGTGTVIEIFNPVV